MSELREIPEWQSLSASRSMVVQRSYAVEFDVKRSRRIIEGRAVPYGVPESVADLLPDGSVSPRYLEAWQLGVFGGVCSDPANVGRVALQLEHDEPAHRLNRIGKPMELVEESDGLYGTWKVVESDGGDWILSEAAEGRMRGMSVSARPRQSEVRGGIVTRIRAALDHVALTAEAAFSGAQVLAVRAQPKTAKWDAQLARMRAERDQMLR